MANNLEKFTLPRSIQQRAIKDGLADYEEQLEDKDESVEVTNKKIDEIIDSFFVGGSEHSSKDTEHPLSKKLNKIPQGLRNQIFKRWLEKEPYEALSQMDEFGPLPSYFQKNVADALSAYLVNNEVPEVWAYHNIINAFGKITDQLLHKLIVDSGKLNFSDFAANKAKFPYFSEKEILGKAYRNHFGEYFDWSAVIPYIDKFPSIDKNEAIQGVLKQHANRKPEVLIQYREKIGLSSQELIDLCFKYRLEDTLARNLQYIDSRYYEEIADKLIDQGYSWVVLQNARSFYCVDAKIILSKILASTVDKNNTGFEIIATHLGEIALVWGKYIPKEFFDNMLVQRPELLAQWADKFGDNIDRNVLIEKLFKDKNFGILIDFAPKLLIRLDNDFAIKIIEHGGAEKLAERIVKFERLSRVVYARLTSICPKEAYPIVLAFDGITRDDIYVAIENLPPNHYIINEIMLNLEILNEDFPNILLKGNHLVVLARNYGKPLFENFFKTLAERLGGNNFEKYKDPILDLLSHNESITLEEEDFKTIADGHLAALTFSDLNALAKTKRVSEFSLACEDHCKEIYLALKEKGQDWQDAEINKNFERGAAVFGYSRMLVFAKSGYRHDALFGFDRVLELQKNSGLDSNNFYYNILQQVAMDTGTYAENNSTPFQILNNVAHGFNPNIEGVLDEARNIEGIPQLSKLLDGLKKRQDIFQSWKMLMQYRELTTLLERRELLDELAREKNQKLKQYISTLLFHPSVTDTHSVKLFWNDPYSFFELESSHTPHELHNLKKPTNYVNIPNLDLSPVELRDALVDGALDKIQAWQPLEINYEMASNPNDGKQYQEFLQKSLAVIMPETLGRESKGVKNKKKLFSQIINILETQLSPGQSLHTRQMAVEILQKIARGEKVEEMVLSDIIQQNIKDAVYFGEFGYAKTVNTTQYKMKINLKSDPDGVVAGSDTQCCMPFGDGKNTLYTYNPICALMTVQRKTERGEYRTIAQSVITKDKDIKTPIANIIARFNEIKSREIDVADLFPQDVLHKEDSYIACDSVEIANNYQTPEYAQLLAGLYHDFLREYTTKFGKDQHLNQSKSMIGRCRYDLTNGQREVNTYLPESPVAYSDKYSESVSVLHLAEPTDSFFVKRNVKITGIDKLEMMSIQNPQIEYLSYQDSLETAYIEGKVYEGTTLKQGISEMENALIAKDINNATKHRPNMSLKYISTDQQMQAYLVAYEGVYGYSHDGSEKDKQESCIYIMDIAKLPEAKKGAGAELINEFIRLYQENYIKKGKFIPIRAEAREVSSYKLILRHLDAWGRSIGVKFELEEREIYEKGGDTMHSVAIRPSQIEV